MGRPSRGLTPPPQRRELYESLHLDGSESHLLTAPMAFPKRLSRVASSIIDYGEQLR